MVAMTLVIGHRGASASAPENTVTAFRLAAEIGADAVELDVRRGRGGAMVVHHDAHLRDGRAVLDLAESDLPAAVPTFRQALDACGTMIVNVEIKNDPTEPDFDPTEALADHVASELARRGGGRRWLVSSFRLATVDRMRAALPSARTALLTMALTPRAIEVAATHGHGAIHPFVDTVDEVGIRRAHAAGLAVNVWTCNDPDRMAELIAWGVDGICTDLPDAALEVRRRVSGDLR